MRLLETEWDKYRRQVLPPDAPPIQIQECRRAFFGGAWAIYSLMMNKMTSGDEVKPEDLQMMASLDREMRNFGERAKRGEV